MTHAAVLGAGSWGTALAILLAKNGLRVSLWGRDRDVLETIRVSRENTRYLPGIQIPDAVEPVATPPEQAGFCVVAVPSSGVRQALGFLPEGQIILVAAKGLEPETSLRMSEVVAQVCPRSACAVVSGPNLAVEVARGIPTATVIASNDGDLANSLRDRFMCRTFRVYTSSDVIGVELGGAIKNVFALGAGMSDGLGFGDNTKAALLARGLKEMMSLGVALGAMPETFMGLSGVGDLIATAVSKLSRNYRVGSLIGSGISLTHALREVGQVAEGVPTSAAAVALAKEHGVEVPLINAIHQVVIGERNPLEAVSELMDRAPKAEI